MSKTKAFVSGASSRHFLSIADLTQEELQFILDTASVFSKNRESSFSLLQGKMVVNLFFEPSTRTRLSFELAIRRLGGTVLNFAASSSSLEKGESLLDTAKNIRAMHPQGIVVRYPSAGGPYFLSRHLDIPVINAGDGFHEHPTQALLDAFTIQEKLGSIKGKRVVIIGDIAHSRVARSNIYALKKLGASVAICAPPTLMPPEPEKLGVDTAYRPESLLPDADVVMALRIQLERQNRMQLPSLGEYARFWGLNQERAKLLKKTAIVLHPGPINRGVELDPEVADSDRSVILDQVSNGIDVRMAVLARSLVPKELDAWLEKNRG